MAVSEQIKSLFQKKILGVPAPLVIGGGAVIAYLGYRYYKNRAAATSSAQSTPSGSLVTNPSVGQGAGGNPSSPDYSGQLAQLSTALGTLQGNLANLNQGLAGLQGQETGLQGQITALQQAPAPAATTSGSSIGAPVALPPPLITYPQAVPQPAPVAASPYAQQSNLGATSAYQQFYDQTFLNPTPLPAAQRPFFNPNPVSYSGPTGPSGYNIPVYQPLPQYAAPAPISGYTGTQVSSGYVPSAMFGSGSNAFKVQGHYITYPNGQSIWVAG